MAGIYIHIPFCKQRCKYCAFYSSTKHGLKGNYVVALCEEIATRRNYITENINTIYFGGGTPSSLSHSELRKIFDTIESNYTIDDNPEITLEANPDDLSPEYLNILSTLPFSRLSMGVQSFNNKQLSTLGRRHNAERARMAVHDARNAGFKNISIDLMFALPGSSLSEWQESLECAIELQPEHISAYNLTYEEGTSLYNEMQQGKIHSLSEEENIAQFETLIDTLTKANYRHYEISNFAKQGYESRHNSNYWNNTPYLGCGAAAHSYNGSSRQWNIDNIELYIKGIEEKIPCFEVEQLNLYERYNDTILTRLRTAKGVSTRMIREQFGNDIATIMMKAAKPHIENHNLKEEQETLSLTRKGIFISDYIIRDLIITN